MTKIEREILSKKITEIIKNNKYLWEDLKEQIADYGYQIHYTTQDAFIQPIDLLIENLKDIDKNNLINEWKDKKQNIQFKTDKEYLEQYKLYAMEELVKRASKVAYN